MPNMQHVHGVAFDREQDAVDMRSSTVEKLTELDGRVRILWSERATRRETHQGGDDGSEREEPPLSRFASLLRSEPVIDRRDVAFGLIR